MTGLFSLNYILIREYSLFIQSPLYSDNAIYPNIGGVLDRSLGTKKKHYSDVIGSQRQSMCSRDRR